MIEEKEERIKEAKMFNIRLGKLITYSVLWGAMMVAEVYLLNALIEHLWTQNLPYGTKQSFQVGVFVFTLVMIAMTSIKISKLYHYFKFLFTMMMEDLVKMATILHGLTGGSRIIEVENPEDIPDFIKNLTGKGPDKETLH